jgi:hypothetical protein
MKLKELLSKFFVVTPLPTMTYKQEYLDPFMNSSWNFSAQAPIMLSVYGDAFGANGTAIVAGSWFLTVLALVWLRSENVMIPMVVAAVLGNTVMFVPGLIPDEWKWGIIALLIVLPIGAFFYTLIKGRN